MSLINNPPEKDLIQTFIIQHFKNIRKKQQSIHYMNDILFLIKFVNESVKQPIPVLREIGIIITQDEMHLDLDKIVNIIQADSIQKIQLCLQKVPTKKKCLLSKLIGEAAAKNWKTYGLPFSIKTYVNENNHLIAAPNNINMNYDPTKAAQKMKMDFPLVSIHYEREHQSFDIFHYEPSEEKPKRMETVTQPLIFVRDEFRQ